MTIKLRDLLPVVQVQGMTTLEVANLQYLQINIEHLRQKLIFVRVSENIEHQFYNQKLSP